ncbi:MAG TPA: Uma2 family endonuclease [Chloroflexota bacterium]|nr:Uma2 family endonuclease [Chloroflexota bacterium]
MAIVHKKLTYEDLLETPDDGKRYEIIDGELYVSAAPFTKHQRAVWNFIDFFKDAERAGYGRGYSAPTDVMFDEYNVVEPDLLFVLAENRAVIKEANIQGAPDILVEVLSSSTRKRDAGVKMQLYARFGVRFYYIIDPEDETVQPYELAESDYRELPLLKGQDAITCPLFPGISMPVSKLFA